MTTAILLEGIQYLGLLVFLCFGFASLFFSIMPLMPEYETWWHRVYWVDDTRGNRRKRVPWDFPDWLRAIVAIINYGLLSAAAYIVWQKPIFVDDLTGIVLDDSDFFTSTQRAYYLTLLSLGFIEWFMAPLWMITFFKYHNPGNAIAIACFEIVILILLNVFGYLFYYIPAILYSVYLAWCLYALTVNVAYYIRTKGTDLVEGHAKNK